jgi:hypothetical protein
MSRMLGLNHFLKAPALVHCLTLHGHQLMCLGCHHDLRWPKVAGIPMESSRYFSGPTGEHRWPLVG